MPLATGNPCAPILRWWIRHNPTYLCSAALMAIGARLTLVSPHTRAGQLGIILLTLGALQLYEWLVAGILIALHRSRRSAEDEPSLLIVASLFWMGPLAATAEMTARNGKVGLLCSILVAAIALLELAAIRRQVQLTISSWGRALAAASVLMLAETPPLFRIPEHPDGRNELYVYLVWWILPGLALLILPAVRSHVRSRRFPPPPLSQLNDLWFELTFLTIVLGSTVAQLAAMNYAFFAHARFFYAAPLLIVVAVIGFELLAEIGRAGRWPAWLFALLPAVAVASTLQGFDPNVPSKLLGPWRDPTTPLLFAAALAWWFGYARHAHPLLLHAGNGALALGLWRMLKVSSVVSPQQIAVTAPDGRDLFTLILYGLTAYLLLIAWLRGSRRDALAAIIVHQAALTLLVWERTSADVFILLVAAGWHFLTALHVLSWWPRLRFVLVGVTYLLLVSWCYDFTEFHWLARANAGMVTMTLFIAGLLWHWTGYRRIAGYTALSHLIFYPSRELSKVISPVEAGCIMGAFGLLAIGAFVSWKKDRLLSAATSETLGISGDLNDVPEEHLTENS